MPRHPPDHAIVIRFGSSGRWQEKAVEQAQESLDDELCRRALLSIWVVVPGPGESVRQAVIRACDSSGLGYRYVRLSTVGRLAGVASLEPDPLDDVGDQDAVDEGSTCHYNADIGTVSVQRVGEFLKCFDEEFENPTWPRHRRR